MFVRLITLLGGISFCGLGYKVYTVGQFWSWQDQMYIDYTGMQKPMGIFMISVGVMCLFGSVWIRNGRKHICLDCEYIDYLALAKDKKHRCVKCRGVMEELEGFYERHPEK